MPSTVASGAEPHWAYAVVASTDAAAILENLVMANMVVGTFGFEGSQHSEDTMRGKLIDGAEVSPHILLLYMIQRRTARAKVHKQIR